MNPRVWMVSLGALSAIGPISVDMYLPATSVMATALGAAPGAVSLTLASYLVGVLIGQSIHGVVSDRYGRKGPLYGGLLVYTVASFGCAAVEQVEWLIALRFVQGIGGSAGAVIVRAMIHDRADTREMARSFSLLMLTASVAPLLAPLAGATLLQAAGWRVIFATMGGLGTLLLALSIAMPETSDRSRRLTTKAQQVTRVWGEILWDRQFLACTLSNAFLQGGMYAYLSLASIVLIDVYGMCPMHFSVIFAIHSLGMVAAGQINARLVRCVGLRRIVQKALWTSVAFSVALTAFPDPPPLAALLVGTFVCISAIGMVAPNLTAMALERHSNNAGSASALLGTVLYGVGAATGAVAAHLSSTVPTRALVHLMAWCVMLAVLFSFGTRDESA